MRAIVCDEFGPFENMTIKDMPTPILAAGEVLVDVKAAGVSFAQSLTVAGKYQVKPALPFIPGVEVAGVVSAVSNTAKGVCVGDRVFAGVTYGGFAEQVIAHDYHCRSLPDGMDFAQGTLMVTSYPTSYAALIWKARLHAGETVLVHGAAGAVGMAAVQIAKAKGAQVIATAGTDEKCAVAERHGADLTINYATSNFRDTVKDWTDGKGVDVVIDPVGGDILYDSLRAMGRESRLITLGYASGDIPKPPINLLLVKNMSIIGLNFGTYMGWGPGDDGRGHVDKIDALHADLASMFNADQLQPEVSHRFPLDQFNDAMNVVLGRQSVGKVVLEP
jgi:NADPH:quinone reductase